MKTATATKPAQKWATMNKTAKAVFVGKVCVMVCTGGFVFGGVLVEGMVYPSYQDQPGAPD